MPGIIFHPPAWRGWFHVVGNTYGTWLHGDTRGFRTRHHREHVEGDYKHPPPPGTYEALQACSERAMKRPAVVLSPEARAEACRLFAKALRHHAVEVVDLVITAKHYHLLARFPATPEQADDDAIGASEPAARTSARDDPPRHFVGIAKKQSAIALGRAGLVAPGGVWAKRCRPLPVRSRGHQLHVVRYIREHALQGGAVWSLIERGS